MRVANFDKSGKMPEVAVFTEVIEKCLCSVWRKTNAFHHQRCHRQFQRTELKSTALFTMVNLCCSMVLLRWLFAGVCGSKTWYGCSFCRSALYFAPKGLQKSTFCAPEKSESGGNISFRHFAVNQLQYDDQYVLVSIGLHANF